MWEFYLAASEYRSASRIMMVIQIQLTKRQGVVPITRDYISTKAPPAAAAEGKRRPPLRLAGECSSTAGARATYVIVVRQADLSTRSSGKLVIAAMTACSSAVSFAKSACYVDNSR